MGKNYYLGGSTQIDIYNKKNSEIRKIYKIMHENFITQKISYETLKEYFEDYDYEDIVEILEDIKINYQGRRLKLLNNLQNNKTSNLELQVIKKKKRFPILKFSCKNLLMYSKLLGDFYLPLKKDVKIFFNFEINKLEKKYQTFLILKVIENGKILFFKIIELTPTLKFLTVYFERDVAPYFNTKVTSEDKKVYNYLKTTFDLIFEIQENSISFQDFISKLENINLTEK